MTSKHSSHTAQVVERRPLFRLEFPATLLAARDAGVKLREFFAEQNLAGEDLDAWELAVVEAANNGVKYVPESRRMLPMVIEASVGIDRTEVRIHDHTDGFDFPDEPELPDGDSEHGRGLFLIKTLTDSADYQRGKKGNCLVLSKNRGPVGGGRPPATVEELERELALMTEELAASYESLSAIFSFTSTLTNALKPMDLVEPWMKELARITGADWHAFFVLAPDGERLVKATGDGIAIPDAIQLPNGGVEIPQMCTASRSVMTRQDVWFDSQMVFHPHDAMRVVCAGTSGLLHSVFQGATLVGLAALGRRVDADPFTAGQVNVIHTFADFLGTQIRHAQAQQEVIENRVLRRDLEIAAGIQHSLLPAVLPHAPGLDIFGSSTSAQEVGGDFYDVIGLPGGSVLIVIADVMGKGVSAALFTAILRALVRSRRDIARHPEALLEWIASTLFADLDRVEMFATMQLAYFDARSSTVKVSGAGHCPLLVATPDGKIQSLRSEGLPIGIKNVSDYESIAVPLVPGSRLVLYTDGVTDVRNAAGEEWGMENLNDWLARSDSASASALGESLLREIADYRGGTVAPDDITFVVITTQS